VEVFDRAAAAGARLLRVEERTPADRAAGAQYLLTFDVGRVLVRGVGGRALEAVHMEERDDLESELSDASEQEPWWRLLGAQLARKQPAPDARQVRLQFLIADARPRMLRLTAEPGGVRALIESGD